MITRLTGLILMLGSLALVYLFEGAAASETAFRIFHWPAMVLTTVGPVGMILLCTPTRILGEFFILILGPSSRTISTGTEKQTSILHKISEDYYSRGTVVFSQITTEGLNPMIQSMIERLAIKIPPQDVRELLLRDREILVSRFQQVLGVPGLGVKLAPSLGMLGTILGMTQLLSHLKDPTSLGTHMSLALLTTFYGLFCSLVIWTPIEQYLMSILSAHERYLDQAEHWIELLERRKPAQYFAGELVHGKSTIKSVET